MAMNLQIVFDCADPDRLARFWASALGYVVQPPPPGYESWDDLLREMGVPEAQWRDRSAVVDPDGIGPRVFFQKVPEAKTLKNRVHLDISVAGPDVLGEQRRELLDAESQRLAHEGATVLRFCDEHGEQWVTLADPEGNEFDLQ